MPKVVHFEINAKKPELLAEFYQKVFGWKIGKWEGPVDYWLITTGRNDEPRMDGGLPERTNAEPSTVNTIDILSVDEFTKKAEMNGGTVVSPKPAVSGGGYMVYFKDPEGNVFGMMEEDPSAQQCEIKECLLED